MFNSDKMLNELSKKIKKITTKKTKQANVRTSSTIIYLRLQERYATHVENIDAIRAIIVRIWKPNMH